MSSNVISIISIILSITAIAASVLLAVRQYSLQENSNLLATIEFFREWRSEEFKVSYVYVMTRLANENPPKNGFAFTGEALVHAVRVSHYLDNLGLLVYSKAIRRDLVLGFIGGAIIDC
jgi:hypothetical protein